MQIGISQKEMPSERTRKAS